MQLIHPLASGIVGAESGTAIVVNRSTSQYANVYTDPDGLSEDTATSHALGASGEGIFYVAQDVEVRVYNAAGTLKRTFVVNNSANNTEYIGASFTGVDPTTQLTGANKPVPVGDVLDLVYAAFGATDFNLQKDVASTPATWTPKRLSVTVGTAFFSVKDPTYGAKGDGSTNDRAAIQSAIDAAEAAGGGVVLVPPGTYNINAALVNDSDGVHIMGIGTAIIQVTAGNVNAFTLTADKTKVSGLRIRLATTVGANSTAYAISASGCDSLFINDVRVEYSPSGSYKWLRALHITGSSTYCTVDKSYLLADATGTYAVLIDGTSNYITIGQTTIGAATGGAIHFNAALDSSLVGCHVSAVGAAITNTGPSRVTLTGNDVYSSGSNAYVATSSARVVTGSNVWFSTGFSVAANAAGVNSVYTDTPLAGADLTANATVSPANPGVHKFYTITAHTANIDTITATGFPTGFILYLKSTVNSQINDGSGNIKTSGASFALTANDMVALLWDGTNWLMIGGTDN
ncbi:MAG: glycosyl hydrolase family 28-related protein [Nitrospira sp.]|nr:glycosyl hydrolase family 28-related protein [Nitrospira sp.]